MKHNSDNGHCKQDRDNKADSAKQPAEDAEPGTEYETNDFKKQNKKNNGS